MRPNYAQDAPPTSLEVGGFLYPVQVDYRIWIDVLSALEDWIDGAETEEQLRHNAQIYDRVQQLVFGGRLVDEEPAQVLEAVAKFAQGYPAERRQGGENGPTLFSLEADINAIVIAIRNQSGIDLSYRRKEPFHWWEFLLEFQTLCGDHYILNVMEVRGYRGDDPELQRRRRMCELPGKKKAGDAVRLQEIGELFYNA